MKKNIFKKHAQLFIINHRKCKIVIEREDNSTDMCYVSDGQTMLKLPYCFYLEYIEPLNDIFIHLEKGYSVTYPINEKAGLIAKDNQLAKIWESVNTEHTVEFTNIKIERTYPRKGEIRIAKIGNRIAAFDDDYYMAIREYTAIFNGTCKSSGVTSVMKYENEIIGCLIAPIRPDEVIKTLRTITGTHNL